MAYAPHKKNPFSTFTCFSNLTIVTWFKCIIQLQPSTFVHSLCLLVYLINQVYTIFTGHLSDRLYAHAVPHLIFYHFDHTCKWRSSPPPIRPKMTFSQWLEGDLSSYVLYGIKTPPQRSSTAHSLVPIGEVTRTYCLPNTFVIIRTISHHLDYFGQWIYSQFRYPLK